MSPWYPSGHEVDPQQCIHLPVLVYPIVLALRRWWQDNQMVRIMLVYTASQKASLATSEPVGGEGVLREHFKNRNTVE